MRFKLVDIRLAWDEIKPHVEALKGRYSFDWRPEDVYAQCLTGRAFCYVCDDGFMIVKPQENQFTLEKELFMWIGIGWSGEDLINEYYEDTCAIAKEIYATKIVFDSSREGFRKVAKNNHWGYMATYSVPVV